MKNAAVEHGSTFPAEAFERFSKQDLVTVLGIMHRILDATGRRDLERVLTELPVLFSDGADVRTEGDAGAHDGLLSTGEHTYHLLSYFITCLSKAQARIENAQPGPKEFDKRSCHLSPRELTVLLWMKEGKTNWEIARILGLSERTVRFHVGGIFEKLDVTSRTQAVARALGSGLIAS